LQARARGALGISLDYAGATRAGNETSESDGAVLFSQLSAEKRLLVKLLYIEDFDLDAAEIQQLANGAAAGCGRSSS